MEGWIKHQIPLIVQLPGSISISLREAPTDSKGLLVDTEVRDKHNQLFEKHGFRLNQRPK